MKKLLYLFIALSSFVTANSQSVGIGTTAPNTNAILDIFSNNKGVLIPRITDTGTVPNPLEGMIIYNKNTKTPYYHNGQQWVSLGGRLLVVQTHQLQIKSLTSYVVQGSAVLKRKYFRYQSEYRTLHL